MNANLSASQRNKISQFKSITNISNDNVAIIALKKTNWNLDVTISQFFENPNELLNAESQNNNNNNNNNINTQNNVNSNENGWSSYAMFGWNFLQSIFGSVFGFIYPYISNAFSMISASANYSNISQTQIVNELESTNSQLNGIFVKTSLNDLIALSFASSKCIFIYFNNAQSRKCIDFSLLLTDNSVKEYLQMNCIGWLGDKRSTESSHLWRQISHGMNDKRFPFVCIAGIHPTSKKLVLVHRQYCGNCTDPTALIGHVLDYGCQRWTQFKTQQIIKEQQTQSNRNLRFEQDIEYNRAVMEQKEMKENGNENGNKNENETEKNIEKVNENENENKYEMRMESAKQKLSLLQQELDNYAKQDLVKVALRLPNGKRVQHIFWNESTIGNLFDFAMSNPLKIGDQFIDQFELVCSYPKKTFSMADHEKTLKEAGIEKGGVLLFVQET